MSKRIIFSIILIVFLGSCVSTKKSVYFHDMTDTKISATADTFEPIIQKNDLLSISVSSLNSEASKIFNTPNSVSTQFTAAGTVQQAFGYLVDPDGNIQLPHLGTIKAEGLTKRKLKEIIFQQIVDKKLLLDPIINIRFINYKVSVLGEVKSPGVFIIPSEKVTLLEAIGLAGDLTIYAKRDNILLIREENGMKEIKRINLNNTEIFSSPYYHLRANDIVYVEPNKRKVHGTSHVYQWLPVVFSFVSVSVLILDHIFSK